MVLGINMVPHMGWASPQGGSPFRALAETACMNGSPLWLSFTMLSSPLPFRYVHSIHLLAEGQTARSDRRRTCKAWHALLSSAPEMHRGNSCIKNCAHVWMVDLKRQKQRRTPNMPCTGTGSK